MNLPGRSPPRLMKSVGGFGANGVADIRGAVVFVVPEQISRDADPAGRMVGRFDGHVRRANETRHRLKASAAAEDRVLGARTDFANDRCRVANLGSVIEWLLEKFEMPVVEIGAAAIGGFGRTGVGDHKVAGDGNN